MGLSDLNYRRFEHSSRCILLQNYKMRTLRENCIFPECYRRAGKDGFCRTHKDEGEAVLALLLLKQSN